MYALIGYNSDTKKVLGTAFKSNKLAVKDDSKYIEARDHALKAIPPPGSEITYIRVNLVED